MGAGASAGDATQVGGGVGGVNVEFHFDAETSSLPPGMMAYPTLAEILPLFSTQA
jgi:hypothetical protein